jgi:acetyl-CoA carboxylase biotin carboxyl carrier protein
MAPVQHVAAPVHHAAPPAAAAAPATGAAKGDEGLITMKSPMVGTFYAAANPVSDPYVSVGAEVSKDKTVVCVIEAMKVFNEIHADTSGTITRILVSNGQTVEFGQPLFLVKPA